MAARRSVTALRPRVETRTPHGLASRAIDETVAGIAVDLSVHLSTDRLVETLGHNSVDHRNCFEERGVTKGGRTRNRARAFGVTASKPTVVASHITLDNKELTLDGGVVGTPFHPTKQQNHQEASSPDSKAPVVPDSTTPSVHTKEYALNKFLYDLLNPANIIIVKDILAGLNVSIAVKRGDPKETVTLEISNAVLSLTPANQVLFFKYLTWQDPIAKDPTIMGEIATVQKWFNPPSTSERDALIALLSHLDGPNLSHLVDQEDLRILPISPAKFYSSAQVADALIKKEKIHVDGFWVKLLHMFPAQQDTVSAVRRMWASS